MVWPMTPAVIYKTCHLYFQACCQKMFKVCLVKVCINKKNLPYDLHRKDKFIMTPSLKLSFQSQCPVNKKQNNTKQDCPAKAGDCKARHKGTCQHYQKGVYDKCE